MKEKIALFNTLWMVGIGDGMGGLVFSLWSIICSRPCRTKICTTFQKLLFQIAQKARKKHEKGSRVRPGNKLLRREKVLVGEGLMVR